ncbi:MAG: glutamyl-tRNA reductase [Phycisphaerae bacterium]|jgi:glutamyl-tRNA reductase
MMKQSTHPTVAHPAADKAFSPGTVEIAVLGASFRTAGVHQREQLALDETQAFELLETVRNEDIFEEALILSTCNRTEIYYVAHPGRDEVAHLLEHLAAVKGLAQPIDRSLFYQHHGLDAVAHLFRVAGALDSQIVGEHEILGQLKDAYRIALQSRTARFLMHKLMHRAFGVGKRVQTETNLGQGTASVPAAAVELARAEYGDLSGKTVMLVGAGKTAELAAQALLRAGATQLIVANRTVAHAHELAAKLPEFSNQKLGMAKFDCSQCPHFEKATCPAVRGDEHACPLRRVPSRQPTVTARGIGIEEVPAVIGQVDLLISSTGSKEAVLTLSGVGEPLRRAARRILIIDIAVPRDVEAEIGLLPNVRLFNLDDLDRQVAANIQKRQAEIPGAQAIADDEARQFEKWLDTLAVVPTIKLLQERAKQLQQHEIDRHAGKFRPEDRPLLEHLAHGLCHKLLHNPLTFLTRLSGSQPTSGDLAAVDLIRQMFKLDDEDDRPRPPG